MQVDVPFRVEYLTPGTVPIAEVIASLSAIQTLTEEGASNLGIFIPGLVVESVQVNVRSITHESPLRELFLLSLFLTFQKDLEKEVPAMVGELVGTPVPDSFDTIVTISVLAAAFYGVAFAKDLLTGAVLNSAVKQQLTALIEDVAKQTGRTPEEIRAALDRRYQKKKRVRLLAASAIKFFKPSKSQDNAPIRVGDTTLSREVVADVPTDFAYEDVVETESSKDHRGVELDLHAQDRDRDSVGWAAVPKGITGRRLRMKLVDGVSASDLWNRDSIKGDITIKSRKTGTDLVPYEIHLTRIYD